MVITTAKWTLNDYHPMISTGRLDEKDVELIKEDVIEMTPSGKPHAYFSTRTAQHLPCHRSSSLGFWVLRSFERSSLEKALLRFSGSKSFKVLSRL